jgi:hypothetical protein
MRKISKWSFIATSVRIEFEDGPVFFTVPRGATLAQVSENLDKIGKRRGGQPLAIDVIFKAHKERANLPLPPPDSADLIPQQQGSSEVRITQIVMGRARLAERNRGDAHTFKERSKC